MKRFSVFMIAALFSLATLPLAQAQEAQAQEAQAQEAQPPVPQAQEAQPPVAQAQEANSQIERVQLSEAEKQAVLNSLKAQGVSDEKLAEFEQTLQADMPMVNADENLDATADNGNQNSQPEATAAASPAAAAPTQPLIDAELVDQTTQKAKKIIKDTAEALEGVEELNKIDNSMDQWAHNTAEQLGVTDKSPFQKVKPYLPGAALLGAGGLVTYGVPALARLAGGAIMIYGAGKLVLAYLDEDGEVQTVPVQAGATSDDSSASAGADNSQK